MVDFYVGLGKIAVANPKRDRIIDDLTRTDMLNKWTEILPMFVVRWLAVRYCERVPYAYEGRVERLVAVARPDILIKVEQKDQSLN